MHRRPRKMMTRDRKTGRLRRKDMKRSMLMRRVGAKRRGKKLRAATKMKMKRSRIKMQRTGRTSSGRRVVPKNQRRRHR